MPFGSQRTIKLYTPHPAQKLIVESPKRYKIIRCGRRFGKTLLALNEIVIASLRKPGDYWIIYPTYRQAKSVAWKTLLGILEKIPGIVKKVRHVDLEVDLANGSNIALKGSDKEHSLRGVGLSGVIMDEYSYIKPHIWFEIVRPMLVDSKGWAWFISTPKGYNHFYELWQKANPNKFEKFHFTTYDNPYIPKSEIEEARAQMDEDTFAQEFLAEFRRLAGAVYKEFDRDTHVIKPLKTIPPEWTIYTAIDFGQVNPTAVLWIAIKPDDTMVIFDEVYEAGLTIKELAERIKQKEYTLEIRGRTADSAAAQQIKELEQYGIYCRGVSKKGDDRENYVKAKIKKVIERLKPSPITGKPRLYVTDNCHNTIFEFENYSYPSARTSERNPSELPVKAFDHAMDALGDFIYDYDVPHLTKRRKRRILVGGDPITGYGKIAI